MRSVFRLTLSAALMASLALPALAQVNTSAPVPAARHRVTKPHRVHPVAMPANEAVPGSTTRTSVAAPGTAAPGIASPVTASPVIAAPTVTPGARPAVVAPTSTASAPRVAAPAAPVPATPAPARTN